MFLIDTSVWIDFLRGKDTKKVQFLEVLLQDGDASLNENIYAEICYGSKNENQFLEYSTYFSEIPILTLPEKWHIEIARYGFLVRKKGYKPSTADLMIALTAKSSNVPLVTEDSDFDFLSKIIGFELWK